MLANCETTDPFCHFARSVSITNAGRQSMSPFFQMLDQVMKDIFFLPNAVKQHFVRTGRTKYARPGTRPDGSVIPQRQCTVSG